MNKKRIFAAACLMAALSFPGLTTYASGADSGTEIYRDPALSGFTKTWIYEGEEWNPHDTRNKIFADDQEDGDLTKKISTEGTVNPAKSGTYTLRHTVTDSDGRTAQIEQEVVVLPQGSTAVKKVQRTLYTLPPASHLMGISFRRGYNHDRQSLGVWLEAGGALKVRLVNAEQFDEELTFDFFGDNNQNESGQSIRLGAEFVTLRNTKDSASVPFVQTPKETDVCPVLEIEWTDQMHEIPYYRYGDDESRFFSQWEESGAPFAILEGQAATFLVPVKDKDKIVNSPYTNRPEYRFPTIDAMLEWYASLMKQYDEYVGLDFYAKEPYNQNVRAKYFVKADQSGPEGSAAYYTSNLSAYTGDSLSEYLVKAWVVLHEFAHGYEGNIASQENAFVETTNNILGHYFESSYRVDTEFGWLLDVSGATKEERFASLEKYAKEWRDTTESFNEITGQNKEYRASLYMFVNALDRLGPKETVSHMHAMYRKYYYETGKNRNSSDAVVESFSDMGYNMMPYFESFHIVPTERIEHEILNKDWPILYYLYDLIPDQELASQVKDKLGLDGVYSLVETDELAYTGYTSRVRFQIEIDDLGQIRNKNIVIKNGKKIVKTIPVTSSEIETELPVGAYEVELPTPDTLAYSYENICLIASKGAAAKTQKITYKKIDKDAMTEDCQLMLYGLGDVLFSSVMFDAEAQKLTLHTMDVQPHSFFEDSYASVRILDTENNELYSLEMAGNQQLDNMERDFDFPVGYKLAVMHREGAVRLCMMSSYADEQKPGYCFGNGETVFVMTEYGPVVESWDQAKRESVYLAGLKQYTEAFASHIDSASLQNPEKYHQEKMVIWNAYQKLSLENKNDFERNWSAFVGGDTVSFYRQIPSSSLRGFADSEEDGEEGSDGPASHAVDGKENTYWHSNYHNSDKVVDLSNHRNNEYTILLDEPKNIGKLAYLPRQGKRNGRILACRLFYSTTEDGNDFKELLSAPVLWEDNEDTKIAEFDAQQARRIRIQVTSSAGTDKDLISAAEFYLYERCEVTADAMDIYLGDLKDVTVESGIQPRQEEDGGIGLACKTTATYNLEGKNFDLFSVYAGVNLANTNGKTAQLQIYGDGALLYDSGPLAGGAAHMANLDIRGVKKLTFTALGDEGLWVSLKNPKFYLTEEKDGVELFVGETARVTANNSMDLGSLGRLSWTSSDESVVVVDLAGNVTAIGIGETTVLLMEEGMAQPKSYQVRVLERTIQKDDDDAGKNNKNEEEIKNGSEGQEEVSVEKPPKMNLKKIKRSGKKALLKWVKNRKAEGYEIWMKQKGAFKKVKNLSAKKTSVKISKLKKGKKYIFKIRAYRMNAAGEKVYGDFSKQKSIKM